MYRRYGVLWPWGKEPPASAPGKELYLIPLPAREPFPEFLDILDHVTIPRRRRDNMLIGVFNLNKGRIVVPAPLQPTTSATNVTSSDHTVVSAIPLQPPLQNDAISSLFSTLGTGPQPAMPFGLGGPPPPMLPGVMAPAPAPGLAYPYPPPPMAAPPPPVAPPADALTALTSSIKNMTPDQINLILKGLTMVSPPPPAPSWAPSGIPVPNSTYASAAIPSHDSYPSPSRSPQYVFF
jgi:hypothetical protein